MPGKFLVNGAIDCSGGTNRAGHRLTLMSGPATATVSREGGERRTSPWTGFIAGVARAIRLADYKHPHRLVIAQGPLPRTSLDKVDKLALCSELDFDFREAGCSEAQRAP